MICGSVLPNPIALMAVVSANSAVSRHCAPWSERSADTMQEFSHTKLRLRTGLTVPNRFGNFAAQVRYQDDQPDTPGEKDAEAAVELRWIHRF